MSVFMIANDHLLTKKIMIEWGCWRVQLRLLTHHNTITVFASFTSNVTSASNPMQEILSIIRIVDIQWIKWLVLLHSAPSCSPILKRFDDLPINSTTLTLVIINKKRTCANYVRNQCSNPSRPTKFRRRTSCLSKLKTISLLCYSVFSIFGLSLEIILNGRTSPNPDTL